MSDRAFSGYVDISDLGPTGMITVRADLADPAITQAIESTGVKVPAQGQAVGSVLWMSPDELMILNEYDAAEAQVAGLKSALGDTHSLVVNVSDARTAFRVTGADERVREVFAKLSPADVRAAALPAGHVRRTRLAQVAGAFWFEADGDARVICFRSVSDYVFELLSNAAVPGSEVGYFG